MNVFNKVTLESLKKNRTRTIVTIIGIMLSAAMICASTTLVSSMQNFVLRCAIHIDGDWYGAVYDAAYKDYEDIRDSDRVSSAAYAQVLGYAKIDSANERKPYLYVLGGDVASGYFKTMPVHLILGTLPKDSTEIILPEHLTSNGKVNYKLGGHLFVAMCFLTASATIPDSSCSNIIAQRFTVASIAFASLNLSKFG